MYKVTRKCPPLTPNCDIEVHAKDMQLCSEWSDEQCKYFTKNSNNLDIPDNKAISYDREFVLVRFSERIESSYEKITDHLIPMKTTVSSALQMCSAVMLKNNEEVIEFQLKRDDRTYLEKMEIINNCTRCYILVDAMLNVWLKDKNPDDLVKDALKLELEYYEKHRDDYMEYTRMNKDFSNCGVTYSDK